MTSVTDIDRSAPVISRHERRIGASVATLWQLHTEIGKWPEWNKDVSQSWLDGTFRIGATFQWQTNGINEPIVSTIHQVETGRRTLWGGVAMEIVGLHEWRFTPDGAATIVTTEESWSGTPVDQNRDALADALAASLERWLTFLDMAAR